MHGARSSKPAARRLFRQAMEEFNRLPFAYREAAAAAASLQTSGTRSAVDVAEVCRKWSGEARRQYLKAASLAKEGK